MTQNLHHFDSLRVASSIAKSVERSFLVTGALAISMGMALLATPAQSQVKPGFGVYAKLSIPGTTNPGGLTIFDPLNGISPCPNRPRFTPVTSLPSSLVSAFATGGANAVLVRDSDGSIVASHIAGSGRMVSVYDLTLRGNAVQAARAYPLATAGASGGGVHQMAWYSKTEVAFVFKGLNSPMAGQGIALLNLVTGAVKRVNISPFPGGSVNAFTLNRDGTTAYLGLYAPNGVYSVPFPGGGVPTKVGPSLLKGPYQLDVDDAGNVYQSTFTLGMFVLRNGSWVRLDSTKQMNAMSIDRVSGDVVFADLTISFPSHMYRWSSTRGRVLLPGMPAKDAPVGIAVRSSLVTSGSPAGVAAYEWRNAPNPGGIPMVGNTGFSLTVATPVAPLTSVMVFSPALGVGPAPLPFGATLLIGPILISAPMQPNGTGTRTSIPIPNQTQFCGVTIHAQSFHMVPAGLASTSAMSITVQ